MKPSGLAQLQYNQNQGQTPDTPRRLFTASWKAAVFSAHKVEVQRGELSVRQRRRLVMSRLTKAADSYIWRVPAGLQVQTSDITTQVSEITITSTETHKSKLFHFLMLQLLFFFYQSICRLRSEWIDSPFVEKIKIITVSPNSSSTMKQRRFTAPEQSKRPKDVLLTTICLQTFAGTVNWWSILTCNHLLTYNRQFFVS